MVTLFIMFTSVEPYKNGNWGCYSTDMYQLISLLIKWRQSGKSQGQDLQGGEGET